MKEFRTVDLILKKKNNEELSDEEIKYLIDGYVSGNIPDYQISSLLMAICFNGLSKKEQVALTMAMLHSGEEVDLSSINGICVDKHSTGGVGDKTTLVVAPIIASCGLKIAKMSGRGLGHTGGTLDKLESVKGFDINVSPEAFLKQVSEIGICVCGQTANITPADKKLYSLRDVTGTVNSVGLIASSIMSKKLASGAKYIVLDVKVGDGAFMKDLESAKVLARAMVDIGNESGRKTVAVITDMDEPLGEAVGNAVEVIEAIETLKGRGPEKFRTLCYELASTLLTITNIASSKDEAYELITKVINDGSALKKFGEFLEAQGGTSEVINDYSLFPTYKNVIEIKALNSGYVHKIKTEQIGLSAMMLGAGRKTKEDVIDLGVGLKIVKHVGDYVNSGDTICLAYVNDQGKDSIAQSVIDAYTIKEEKIERNSVVKAIIE